MLWHHYARVNSHQRWKQTRFRVCFQLWCELTITMNAMEWQVSWNSWKSFLGRKILDFEIFPPPWKVLPPLEIFLATPLLPEGIPPCAKNIGSIRIPWSKNSPPIRKFYLAQWDCRKVGPYLCLMFSLGWVLQQKSNRATRGSRPPLGRGGNKRQMHIAFLAYTEHCSILHKWLLSYWIMCPPPHL